MKCVKTVVIAGVIICAGALPSWAHIEKTEPMQSLRQSYFALIGMTFGPMADMVKGKIDWDQATFERWSSDLAAVATYKVERGFAPGSEEGRTRAKPDIWLDLDEFKEHLGELRAETARLAQVAKSGDRAAIQAQLGVTGKTCKGCHYEYKAKDYLY